MRQRQEIQTLLRQKIAYDIKNTDENGFISVF